jgi:hypothetical protein
MKTVELRITDNIFPSYGYMTNHRDKYRKNLELGLNAIFSDVALSLTEDIKGLEEYLCQHQVGPLSSWDHTSSACGQTG